MYILGIDLAVTAEHQAILADERGRFIGNILKFRTTQADLERIYATARRRMKADEELVVVLEATDIVWYPVAIYFHQREATVYLVNPRMAADLGRFLPTSRQERPSVGQNPGPFAGGQSRWPVSLGLVGTRLPGSSAGLQGTGTLDRAGQRHPEPLAVH